MIVAFGLIVFSIVSGRSNFSQRLYIFIFVGISGIVGSAFSMGFSLSPNWHSEYSLPARLFLDLFICISFSELLSVICFGIRNMVWPYISPLAPVAERFEIGSYLVMNGAIATMTAVSLACNYSSESVWGSHLHFCVPLWFASAALFVMLAWVFVPDQQKNDANPISDENMKYAEFFSIVLPALMSSFLVSFFFAIFVAVPRAGVYFGGLWLAASIAFLLYRLIIFPELSLSLGVFILFLIAISGIVGSSLMIAYSPNADWHSTAPLLTRLAVDLTVCICLAEVITIISLEISAYGCPLAFLKLRSGNGREYIVFLVLNSVTSTVIAIIFCFSSSSDKIWVPGFACCIPVWLLSTGMHLIANWFVNGWGSFIQNQTTRTLYHQTGRDAAERIKKSQIMICGSSGLAGGGIYFADSKEETQRKCHDHGVMLAADVDLGKWLIVGNGTPGNARPDPLLCDSVFIRLLNSGVEYVVYDTSRIKNIREIPMY
jgi:hypothetical protein